MYALVAIKLLRKWLLDTYQSPLKECVKSGDGYWSVLTYTGQPMQNMLGQILMELRQFIRIHQSPRNVPGQLQ